MAATAQRGVLRGPRLWLRAFIGFYPPKDESIKSLDPISKFLFSARSVILVISAQAAAIAGLLAIRDRRFDLWTFILVLVGYLTAHMLSNLSNDYFGYVRGHDTPDSPRRRYTMHPIASGVLDARTLGFGLAILAVVGTTIVVYFWLARGPIALGFALAGIALLYFYDAAPRPLKSLGLGEIAAFLVWGPLMIGGGYFVITGRLSADAFLASIPYGLGVMSILMGKHIDQAGFDRKQGHRTLPVILGDYGSRAITRILVGAMYVVVGVLVAFERLTPFAGLVVIALPQGLRTLSVLSRRRPTEPPAGYVGWPLWYHRVCLVHNRLFGWMYLAGLALGAAFAI